MVSEAPGGRFGDRFQAHQVVGRRSRGNMPHRRGKDRQLGLRVHPGVIPAQQDMDGIGVANVVDPGRLPGCGEDASSAA